MQPFRLIFLPPRRAVSRGRCVLARSAESWKSHLPRPARRLHLPRKLVSRQRLQERQAGYRKYRIKPWPALQGQGGPEWSLGARSSRAAATASMLLPAAGCLIQAERTGVGAQPVSVSGPAVVCGTALCFHSCFPFLGNKNIFLPD